MHQLQDHRSAKLSVRSVMNEQDPPWYTTIIADAKMMKGNSVEAKGGRSCLGAARARTCDTIFAHKLRVDLNKTACCYIGRFLWSSSHRYRPPAAAASTQSLFLQLPSHGACSQYSSSTSCTYIVHLPPHHVCISMHTLLLSA